MTQQDLTVYPGSLSASGGGPRLETDMAAHWARAANEPRNVAVRVESALSGDDIFGVRSEPHGFWCLGIWCPTAVEAPRVLWSDPASFGERLNESAFAPTGHHAIRYEQGSYDQGSYVRLLARAMSHGDFGYGVRPHQSALEHLRSARFDDLIETAREIAGRCEFDLPNPSAIAVSKGIAQQFNELFQGSAATLETIRFNEDLGIALYFSHRDTPGGGRFCSITLHDPATEGATLTVADDGADILKFGDCKTHAQVFEWAAYIERFLA